MSDDNVKTGEHFSFNEGLSTKPDVDLLLKTWPEPKIGDVFDYGTIGKLIGSEWPGARFRTVTTVWRNRLAERGTIVEAKPSEAFYVATAEETSAGTYGVFKSAGKKFRKQRRKLVAQRQHTADANLIAAVDHQAILLAAAERDTRKKRMNLLPTTAVPEQPKLSPPKRKERA